MATSDGRRECRTCGGVNACHDDCKAGGRSVVLKRIKEAERKKEQEAKDKRG